MALKAISGRDILFKIAEDTDNLKSQHVTSNGSTTTVNCANLDADTNVYQYAIGRILGKGDCIVSSHTNQGVFTVATLDSSSATNDLFQFCWWTPNKAGDALSSMNEAIRYSWPFWYRERETETTITGTVAKAGSTTLTGTSTLFLTELMVGDLISVPGGGGTEVREVSAIASNTSLTVTATFANTASGQTCTYTSNITLASTTHEYVLPSSVEAVLAIGVENSNEPVKWFTNTDDSAQYWRVYGQRGAYRIQFSPTFSRIGSFAGVYSTKTLKLQVACREPELTALTTDTCQLPLDYFIVAALSYNMRQLQTASREDLVTANVAVPLVQEQARLQLQSMGIGKRPPNKVLNPELTLPDTKFDEEPIVEGDTSLKVVRHGRQAV